MTTSDARIPAILTALEQPHSYALVSYRHRQPDGTHHATLAYTTSDGHHIGIRYTSHRVNANRPAVTPDTAAGDHIHTVNRAFFTHELYTELADSYCDNISGLAQDIAADTHSGDTTDDRPALADSDIIGLWPLHTPTTGDISRYRTTRDTFLNAIYGTTATT
jgi:hypothetical protein